MPKTDCWDCKFDEGMDCSNKKWHLAVDNNKPTVNKKDECLFWSKK